MTIIQCNLLIAHVITHNCHRPFTTQKLASYELFALLLSNPTMSDVKTTTEHWAFLGVKWIQNQILHDRFQPPSSPADALCFMFCRAIDFHIVFIIINRSIWRRNFHSDLEKFLLFCSFHHEHTIFMRWNSLQCDIESFNYQFIPSCARILLLCRKLKYILLLWWL